ncbi:MAG: hypothetical protein E7K72_00600 [Roseomonas mucosa]|nr:hypothetical protein [Roseomonas mucosa]
MFRTLPFFATSLGVVVAACAYASTRLPSMPELLRSYPGAIAFAFLALVVFCAVAVLIFLLRAAQHDRYYRPGTERELVDALDAQVTLFATDPDPDAEKAADGLRKATITAYLKVIPYNRTINQERRRLRANAASCLVLSLLFALGATSTIFLADKLGSLPRITP